MTTRLHILVVGPDPNLESEFRSVASLLKDTTVVVDFVRDYRQGIERARDRTPDVVCLEMTTDSSVLRAFSEDLAGTESAPLLIGLYQSQTLTDEHAQLVIEATRAGIRDFLRRPISSGELQEVFDRHLTQRSTEVRSGKIVTFVSNKGGVGKSTLAVNAAVALAEQHPGRVLLIDASLQLGVCASMLDLETENTIAEAHDEIDRLDATLLERLCLRHECGLLLLAAPRNALEAARITESTMSRILSVARRAFDFVLVDTFPLLDGVGLAILDLTDRAYFVTTPSVPTILGAPEHLKVLRKVGLESDRIRVILNSPQPRYSGQLSATEIESQAGITVDHAFPFRKGLLTSANTGVPFVRGMRRWGRFASSLRKLVASLQSAVAGSGTRAGSLDEVARDDTRSVGSRLSSSPSGDASEVKGATS